MNIISRFLSSDDVVLDLDVRDKADALEEAALRVEARHHVNHAPVFRALWRREQSGSTGLGHGVAIPHARIPGISEPITLLVRTKLPIRFGSPDRTGVSVLFVILVPEHARQEHLDILAAVSAMFSDRGFREQVVAAKEPVAVHQLIDEWPARGAPRPSP
ncbi:MAG TPA: PTS sugar transporter subunit IIA [Casimicrobiaceae bacterium]|nr:PTS sugar transporter subunit IIA [Casimicrobiaceae bacterium]